VDKDRVQVKSANRKTRRDIRKVFSDNFLKILTEVVLNSDDSYKRIEETNPNSKVKNIVITLNRKKNEIQVLDNAEGMTAEQMESIFGEYGGDYSGSSSTNYVRGLFGQGAADVMFNAAMSKKTAQIESIKDNVVSKCRFFFSKIKEIDSKVLHPHMRDYRKSTGIIENGTLVTFGLNDKVKIPKEKDIKKQIEQFYMFRYVLSNPLRRVILKDGKMECTLTSKDYLVNEKTILLNQKEIILEYEDRKLTSYLTLFEKSSKLDTKIIIRDENNVVYDETFFGMDKLPGANIIAGELVIPNIAILLRELLNAEDPKELLTDTRDGFDGREDFTKNMNQKVSKILEEEIDKNNNTKDTISVNLSNNKRFNDIMKKINNYYSDLELSSIEGLNPGENPPNDGLKFARPSISITKGKTYDLKLYINASQINPEDIIIITHEGSKFFTTDNNKVTYQNEDIKENNMVVKSVVIKSTMITSDPVILIARCKNYESKVLVAVVDEKIIYPKNGLEFVPKRKNIKPKSKTDYKLYFDTDIIPLGSQLTISQKNETQLFSNEETLIITKKHMLTDNIGLLKVKVSSEINEEKIQITAIYKKIIATAVLYVRTKEKNNDGNQGFLNRIELRFEDGFWQTSLLENKGVLYINGKNIINKSIMGDLGQKDRNNPKFDKNQRKYLYELIANESAKKIVKELFNKEQLQNNSLESIYDIIQKHKTTIYKEIAEL